MGKLFKLRRKAVKAPPNPMLEAAYSKDKAPSDATIEVCFKGVD